MRDKGYRIVWTPYAQLTHYESKSRGGDEKDPVKAARFAAEQQRLYDVHGKADILDDPYYNPSLDRDRGFLGERRSAEPQRGKSDSEVAERMNIKGHFETITRHKLLVMKYCFACGLYEQGLAHDLSKYSPAEFIPGCIYYQATTAQ